MSASEPKSVMVVEDDVEMSELILAVLSLGGFRGAVVRDGCAAIAHAQEARERPCAIVLDLMMAGMDGATFLTERVHEPLLADVPVIAMSGDADRLRAIKPRVFAALVKPFPMRSLLTALEQACPAL